MKLSLTTWQRVMLSTVVGNMRGDVRLMRKAMQAMDVLELTPEEIEEVNFRIMPNGQPAWNNTDLRFDIEIEDASIGALMKQGVEGFDAWPFFNYREVLDLCEQMDINLDDDE